MVVAIVTVKVYHYIEMKVTKHMAIIENVESIMKEYEKLTKFQISPIDYAVFEQMVEHLPISISFLGIKIKNPQYCRYGYIKEDYYIVCEYLNHVKLIIPTNSVGINPNLVSIFDIVNNIKYKNALKIVSDNGDGNVKLAYVPPSN
jgi:hypothetical protein